jgi:hypothetical protein
VDGECVPGLVVSLWPRCQLDLFGDLAARGLERAVTGGQAPYTCSLTASTLQCINFA